MTIVSYAQNFEDVILWRVLNKVENGFYIDVGANHPRIHSVTKVFYDHGWTGINAEPVHEWFSLLEAERPRDINIPFLISDTLETNTIYEFAGTGISTADRDVANANKEKLGIDYDTKQVEAVTLDYVWKKYEIAECHFLKVDVEGFELNVIRGIDLSTYRPWVIVIETNELVEVNDFAESCEKLVESFNYELVYKDGLNRFYLAKEHESELKAKFDYPPNLFDDFCFAVQDGGAGFCYNHSFLLSEKSAKENQLMIEVAKLKSLIISSAEQRVEIKELKGEIKNSVESYAQISKKSSAAILKRLSDNMSVVGIIEKENEEKQDHDRALAFEVVSKRLEDRLSSLQLKYVFTLQELLQQKNIINKLSNAEKKKQNDVNQLQSDIALKEKKIESFEYKFEAQKRSIEYYAYLTVELLSNLDSMKVINQSLSDDLNLLHKQFDRVRELLEKEKINYDLLFGRFIEYVQKFGIYHRYRFNYDDNANNIGQTSNEIQKRQGPSIMISKIITVVEKLFRAKRLFFWLFPDGTVTNRFVRRLIDGQNKSGRINYKSFDSVSVSKVSSEVQKIPKPRLDSFLEYNGEKKSEKLKLLEKAIISYYRQVES